MASSTYVRNYSTCNLSFQPEFKQKMVAAAEENGMTLTAYIRHLYELERLVKAKLLEIEA